MMMKSMKWNGVTILRNNPMFTVLLVHISHHPSHSSTIIPLKMAKIGPGNNSISMEESPKISP